MISAPVAALNWALTHELAAWAVTDWTNGEAHTIPAAVAAFSKVLRSSCGVAIRLNQSG